MTKGGSTVQARKGLWGWGRGCWEGRGTGSAVTAEGSRGRWGAGGLSCLLLLLCLGSQPVGEGDEGESSQEEGEAERPRWHRQAEPRPEEPRAQLSH